MARPYSMDLRRRIVASRKDGLACREVARRFGVSASCAVKLAARERETGSLAPGRLGRPPGSGKLEAYRAFLIATVEAQPDITMTELAARLSEHHAVVAHPASLSRFLRKAGFTYKKNADRIGTPTRRRRQKTS